MPSKIVDLSARSNIIEAEPFGLHFWECTPEEFLNYLKDPLGVLASMGVKGSFLRVRVLCSFMLLLCTR